MQHFIAPSCLCVPCQLGPSGPHFLYCVSTFSESPVVSADPEKSGWRSGPSGLGSFAEIGSRALISVQSCSAGVVDQIPGRVLALTGNVDLALEWSHIPDLFCSHYVALIRKKNHAINNLSLNWILSLVPQPEGSCLIRARLSSFSSSWPWIEPWMSRVMWARLRSSPEGEYLISLDTVLHCSDYGYPYLF